jgi:hypothetical protein
MAFLDWYQRDRKLTDYAPGELRHEEERLRIRENQAVARLKKTREEQEEVFWEGAEVPSAVRRRILARVYAEREAEADRLERELRRLVKESLATAAVRFRLERRLDGDAGALKKTGGEDIDALIESWRDHEVDEDEFSGRLLEVLGKTKEAEGDPLAGLPEPARQVIEAWEKMDREGADEGDGVTADAADDADGEEE